MIDGQPPFKRGRVGHLFGIASFCLFGVFWFLVTSTAEPGAARPSVYFVFIALPAIVIASLACSIVATIIASRWWILTGLCAALYGVL